MVEQRLADPDLVLYAGDALEVLRELDTASIDAVVTSPPYVDMRPEYGTPVSWLPIFDELARVVRGGMLWNVGRFWRNRIEQMWWLNIIDAASDAGWEHWDTLVWFKPNANPIQGNIATNSHEYVLAFGRPGVEFNESARKKPYAPGSAERLRRRWVSSISVKGDGPERSGAHRAERVGERREPNPEGARAPSILVHLTGGEKGNKHPAPMPTELAAELVSLALAEGTVLDPFAGSGTTAVAARQLGIHSVLIEVSDEYCDMIVTRLQQFSLLT